MVVVLIPYTSSAYGTAIHPVGKSYASKVDDEKSAFESGTDSRQHRHKKSRYLHCSCFCRYGRVAVIYEEILISVWYGSIIQLDKLEFVEEIMMEYLENSLTYQEYISLRSSVGWNNFAEEQVSSSISNSVYNIKVVDDNKTIAMGRLIGDGMYYLLVDIVVSPEFQGNGIGSKIIDMLLTYVDNRTPIGGRSSVQLIAEQRKEDFYIKKGFKLIPHEFCGSGMRKIIRK